MYCLPIVQPLDYLILAVFIDLGYFIILYEHVALCNLFCPHSKCHKRQADKLWQPGRTGNYACSKEATQTCPSLMAGLSIQKPWQELGGGSDWAFPSSRVLDWASWWGWRGKKTSSFCPPEAQRTPQVLDNLANWVLWPLGGGCVEQGVLSPLLKEAIWESGQGQRLRP